MSQIELQPESAANAEVRTMPNLVHYRRLIAHHRGAAAGSRLARRSQAAYERLYTRRPRFDDKQVCSHIEETILPGLAVYQALRQDGVPQEDAVEFVQILMEALVPGWYIASLKAFKRLPKSFQVFRRIARRQMRLMYPALGWDTDWIEDTPDRIVFHITRCLYHDVLAAYGAPELTRAFCHNDEVLGDALAPHIVFEREGTIGRGHPLCDFCYRRG